MNHAMHSWDDLRQPIWMFDPVALRGVYANAAALVLWGADSLDELLSRDFSKLSPAVLARVERLAQSTADGSALSERWTFYPRGLPVTVQAAISSYRLDDGRAVLLFEAAPAEVEPGERRAVEALRHTSTLITLFDPSGVVLFTNPAAFSAYGSDVLPFADRFVDPARGQALFEAALDARTGGEVCEILTRDGRRFHHLEARAVTDPVSGAVGVLLNEVDVTARIEAERARTAAEQRAAMAEARQAFLTEMSHELRTPLNAVIGFSHLLRNARLDPAEAEQAGRIHQAGQQLLEVVNGMIRLSGQDGWNGRQAMDAAEPESPTAVAAETRNAPTGAIRVLCVDDNEANRELIVAMLSAAGIACTTAEDGALGVEAARDGAFDLILMDIQMPVMNGVEATRAIRALPGPAAGLPIVAVTANTLDEQVEAYLAAGMDDVIAKPIGMSELLGKVFGWIEQRAEAEADDPERAAV